MKYLLACRCITCMRGSPWSGHSDFFFFGITGHSELKIHQWTESSPLLLGCHKFLTNLKIQAVNPVFCSVYFYNLQLGKSICLVVHSGHHKMSRSPNQGPKSGPHSSIFWLGGPQATFYPNSENLGE